MNIALDLCKGSLSATPHVSAYTFYFTGDKSALRPSGLRFGSPALTSRGMMEEDFKKVAEFIHKGNPVNAL